MQHSFKNKDKTPLLLTFPFYTTFGRKQKLFDELAALIGAQMAVCF